MQNNGRHTKLDGLRGLLSLIVALNHSFLVIAIPAFANVWNVNYLEYHDLQSKLQQIFMILGNGGVAVTLFFILSGLVLGQSLSRIQFNLRGLTSFIIKRLVRLYPVYVVIILTIALYMRFGFTYQVFSEASPWFNWWMNFDMTIKEFLYNLFFIHTYLGGVTWTLRVIVIASFIFPAFYLLYRQTKSWQDLIIIALLIWADFTIFDIPDFRDLRYLYMFYAGLCLPKFEQFFQKISELLIKLSIVPALLLLLVIRYTTEEYFGGTVETLIGWFIIGTIVYHKTGIFDLLNNKMVLFFGKISYSLYLIHFTVLYVIAREMFILFPELPYRGNYLIFHFLLLVISVPLSTLISVFVHRHVEEPSVRVANTIRKRILNQ